VRAMKFKTPGRSVLKTNRFETIQLYQVTPEQETEWMAGTGQGQAQPLPAEEMAIVQRALEAAGGRMTIGLLMEWGMGQREARRLVESYEARGWLEQDAAQGNARVITPKLADLLTNRQTRQTMTNQQIGQQTADKPAQTLNMGMTQ